ncbi:Ankyrin repeat-containing protein [Carex littledalei]|uniref:Ankyrin repeat-containing protein n=1 Tax=Carex littledalei TaxID=544730 RepID=A0A833RJ85_9POAL|nr:Ankyrin repeat-containing protein [Carex littledalei]
MSVNLDRALRKANDLQDEKLYAALLLAEGDQRLSSLLQPPLDHLRAGADLPLYEGSRRQAMCPDLYRAMLSGSINHVIELLGLQEEMTRINNVSHDSTHVEVLLEDTHKSEKSNRHWGGRVHGDGLCTLQEVTAEKNTVLHIAAEQGHVELVEKIIRRDNTLLISQNSKHETPLHLAARAGHRRIVSLIIFLAQESGIGAYEVLTKRSIKGDTVLHEAIRHGHEDVVQVLMTVAPALSVELNNASMSPLYLAVVRNSIGIVTTLLQFSHSSFVGPNQQNALHAAVLQSQEMMTMLLDWKVELANKRDASGSTPIHYATSSGDVAIVKTILDKAPLAVYIQDQEGSSPLHVAARMRHYSAISCMIDHCPDSFELCDNQGRNFLHIVAQHGGRDINLNRQDLKNIISIINLVSQKSDLKKLVNERDNEGNTPLHFASMNGFSEVILHFVKVSKADTTLMNNEGKTALDQAVSLRSFLLMSGAVATLSAYGATFSPRRQDKVPKDWEDETTKWIDRVSKNLIIVSVLIATIAFSAAFNVPGSYNGNGVANLRQKKQYNIFLILDTIAMSTSVSAAMLLVVAKAVSKRGSWTCFCLSLNFLWTSLFTMQLAFIMAVSVTLGDVFLRHEFPLSLLSSNDTTKSCLVS